MADDSVIANPVNGPVIFTSKSLKGDQLTEVRDLTGKSAFCAVAISRDPKTLRKLLHITEKVERNLAIVIGKNFDAFKRNIAKVKLDRRYIFVEDTVILFVQRTPLIVFIITDGPCFWIKKRFLPTKSL